MASKARIRVELDDGSFKELMSKFRVALKKSGILQEYKQRRFYEPPGRKRRREAKEAEVLRVKEKLKENLTKKNNEYQLP